MCCIASEDVACESPGFKMYLAFSALDFLYIFFATQEMACWLLAGQAADGWEFLQVWTPASTNSFRFYQQVLVLTLLPTTGSKEEETRVSCSFRSICHLSSQSSSSPLHLWLCFQTWVISDEFISNLIILSCLSLYKDSASLLLIFLHLSRLSSTCSLPRL